MVATRSAADMSRVSVVHFVTGVETLDPLSIGSDAWVDILHEAVQHVPMDYLRGMKRIPEILANTNSCYGVERSVDDLWAHIVTDKAAQHMWDRSVFLLCHVFGKLPSSYEEALQSGEADEKITAPLDVTCQYLLLSRGRRMFRLQVTWVPREDWDDESMSSSPRRFWYEADPKSYVYEQVTDMIFQWMLAQDAPGKDRAIGEMILQRINMAFLETLGELRGQYERAVRKQQRLANLLRALGTYLGD